MRPALLIESSAVLLALACHGRAGTPGGVKPLAPRERQPGQTIDVSSLSATVRNADSLYPKCPVRPHAEANLVARGVTGVVQYRWERSDSSHSPLRQIELPADSVARVALEPDDWADTLRGVQLSLSEQVHITYPFNVRSAPVDIKAKCY